MALPKARRRGGGSAARHSLFSPGYLPPNRIATAARRIHVYKRGSLIMGLNSSGWMYAVGLCWVYAISDSGSL